MVQEASPATKSPIQSRVSANEWICCQLGAREHYAIPRALCTDNRLALLITDAWADGWLPWGVLPSSKARERFHSAVSARLVASFDWPLLGFELFQRPRVAGWDLTIARNEWFQERTVRELQLLKESDPGKTYTLFSYSYTARKAVEFAREAGWKTVLGQIDPGPFEEKLVSDLYRRAKGMGTPPTAPTHYWESWREECRLADSIIVNSEWSRQGLCREGIAPNKVRVVPLVYEADRRFAEYARTYPTSFSSERPLRVLFLGQVNVRKGAQEILAAISRLKNLPVEVRMVGPVQIPIPQEYRANPRIKWIGPVPRGETGRHYRDADVFLFPTHSDGFGLTQLEAQAWGLPIIASRNCGEVVRHLENGYVLPEVTAGAVADGIRAMLDEPALLVRLATRSGCEDFSLCHLRGALNRIAEEMQPGATRESVH